MRPVPVAAPRESKAARRAHGIASYGQRHVRFEPRPRDSGVARGANSEPHRFDMERQQESSRHREAFKTLARADERLLTGHRERRERALRLAQPEVESFSKGSER
jgi:hypothetical protein